MASFSALDREQNLQALTTGNFDLLVIGGGITGAGIALDAATRGMKVALLEKHDFAYGTSSRSTKLIHGGLRYLKQMEFALVREVGSERAVVHNLAPHLVIPEKMLLPLSEGKSMGYWLTSIGLKIYDLLAGVKNDDRRRMLSRAETLRAEPLLKKAGIKGGALYAEYRTDDARLTTEAIKTAVANGALALNHIEVREFLHADGTICGVKAEDRLTGNQVEVAAAVVVNATGPWVDTLREVDGSKSGKWLHLTKGVHIVVSHHKLPIRQSVYFELSDGRMIFAIPRGGKTYIGTTDTDYKGTCEEVALQPEDISYLLTGVNESFEGIQLTREDVESGWAGLRPLIHEEGKSAYELSRRDEIFESPTGLISIAGGKLTGYRKMAERVVDLVAEKYLAFGDWGACRTEAVKLGNAFQHYSDVKLFQQQIVDRVTGEELKREVLRLATTYGPAAEAIMASAVLPLTVDRLFRSELKYSVEHEMVHGPADFFNRRTGLVYFDMEQLRRRMPLALEFFREQYGWEFEAPMGVEPLTRPVG